MLCYVHALGSHLGSHEVPAVAACDHCGVGLFLVRIPTHPDRLFPIHPDRSFRLILITDSGAS